MNLLDKIRGKSESEPAVATTPEPTDTTIDTHSTALDAARGTESTLAGADMPTLADAPKSIISQAVPTEPGAGGDFSVSTMSFGPTTQAADPTGVLEGQPGAGGDKVGKLLGRHRQLVLTGLVVLGLVGTAVSVSLVLASSNRSSAQVRATGQALMHSQRMAKSVSAALVGNPAAFGELRESVGSLTGIVTNLRTGEGPLAIAPAAVQPTLETLKPLVERAEKNGKVVQAQERS